MKLRHAVLALGLAALAGGADAAAQHAPQAASSWRMPPEEAPLPVWQVSIWLVAPTFADQPAALLGIGRTAPAGGVWTGGGMLRAGVIDYGGGTQHLELEGELHLTRSWWRFDEVGGGCRIESWGDANYDLGPLLRLGFEEPFGRSAYALYGQAAWMPFGVLNDYAVEQLHFELGLHWTGERWSGRLGYRRKVCYGLEQDPEYGGPVLAASWAWD